MRARLRRPSLLTKFSVLSLLVIVALGIGVGLMLHERIERRALLEATQLAETMTVLGLEPILLPGDLAAGQGEDHLDALVEQLELRDTDELGLLRLKAFNSDGVIVYSDERSIVGEAHPDSPGVRNALRGRIGRKLTQGTFDTGRGQRALEVYVPLRLGGAPAPDAWSRSTCPTSPSPQRSPRTPGGWWCCSPAGCCSCTRPSSGSSPSPRAGYATRRCTTTSRTFRTARCLDVPVARRLRHGALVADLPQAAPARRGQDRPLVRDGDDR